MPEASPEAYPSQCVAEASSSTRTTRLLLLLLLLLSLRPLLLLLVLLVLLVLQMPVVLLRTAGIGRLLVQAGHLVSARPAEGSALVGAIGIHSLAVAQERFKPKQLEMIPNPNHYSVKGGGPVEVRGVVGIERPGCLQQKTGMRLHWGLTSGHV